LYSNLKNIVNIITFFRYFFHKSIDSKVLVSIWIKSIVNFKKINLYYLRNEHIWLDGFLFDFLQKKTADMWIRKFVVYTGFIFSERLVFDALVKLYMDNLVWYFHKLSVFEVSNVFEMLSSIMYFLTTLFFTILLVIILF
jgi:hypothetical protein